jgi:hypothetical protein
MPKIKYEVSSQKENLSLDQSDFRDFNPARQYKSARGSYISHFPFNFEGGVCVVNRGNYIEPVQLE